MSSILVKNGTLLDPTQSLEVQRDLLIRDGRVREIPVERITDVLGDLIYGTMFTNYVAGRERSLASQAEGILDLAFNGLLTDRERKRRASARGENGA